MACTSERSPPTMTDMTKPVPTNTDDPCCAAVSRLDLSDATALAVQLSAIAEIGRAHV